MIKALKRRISRQILDCLPEYEFKTVDRYCLDHVVSDCVEGWRIVMIDKGSPNSSSNFTALMMRVKPSKE